MKRTGPTKEKTKKLLSLLRKEGKTKIWKNITKSISAPRRKRATVNLWELEKLSNKFQNKTFLIAGKVLGKGEITKAINIAALEFSDTAKEKINEKKGKTLNLEEAIKIKANELMIVK